MSFRSEKRSPFVDAPTDLANRHRSDPSESDDQPTHHEPNSRDPTAGRKRPQLEPPPSMIQGGRGGGGTANKFRAKYQQKIIAASKVNHRKIILLATTTIPKIQKCELVVTKLKPMRLKLG